jgi:hypothetical protein
MHTNRPADYTYEPRPAAGYANNRPPSSNFGNSRPPAQSHGNGRPQPSTNPGYRAQSQGNSSRPPTTIPSNRAPSANYVNRSQQAPRDYQTFHPQNNKEFYGDDGAAEYQQREYPRQISSRGYERDAFNY